MACCMETKIDSTTEWGPAPCFRVGSQDSGSTSSVASMDAQRERARTSLRHCLVIKCAPLTANKCKLVEFSVTKQGSGYIKAMAWRVPNQRCDDTCLLICFSIISLELLVVTETAISDSSFQRLPETEGLQDDKAVLLHHNAKHKYPHRPFAAIAKSSFEYLLSSAPPTLKTYSSSYCRLLVW